MMAMALPKEVEAQQRALEIGFKYALPWRVREAKGPFEVSYERVSISGVVVGIAEQKGQSYTHCFPKDKRCQAIESDSLADAFADVDIQLEEEGWKIVGRVVWT